jgi:dihydroorotase
MAARRTGVDLRAVLAAGLILPLPDADPVADHLAVVLEVIARADKAALCEVVPAAAITRGLAGETLAEMGELAEAGVRLFTDDGNCVQSARVMRLALEYARAFDVVVCQHAQDDPLTEGWQMHEGHYSALLGLRGAPAVAESIVVARDLALAGLTGGRLHVTHVSAEATVNLLREARASGLRVTADVTPHHLTFTDEDLQSYDTNLKVNPPLRSADDRDALRGAVGDGTIDAVATDHAPHAVEDKEVEFDQARPGTTGLETALALVLTELVEPGHIDLSAAIDRLSVAPARILGLSDQGGPVAAGRQANVVAFDPAAEWTVGDRPFASRSGNSAFRGRRLRGRVVHTLFRGEPVVRDGEALR